MRYRRYDRLSGTPHVVVDGSAQDGTTLTLSHWPGSATPDDLRADLSAEIVFRYLDAPSHHVDVEWVSNNHFDQDGLVGVFALTQPDDAYARRDRLVDIARAGDFSSYDDRDAARAAITMAALGAEAGADDGHDAYDAVLPRTIEIVDHVDRFRRHWSDQDAHITATETAIADGTVTVGEVGDVDVAIVTIPDGWGERVVQQFSALATNAVHPYALHNATDRLVIVTVQGARVQVQYRYETWVQLATRRPRPRVDLTELAAELTALDTGEDGWTFDGVSTLSPRLHRPRGEASTLDPPMVIDRIVGTLRQARSTWSPYDA